MHKEFIDYSKIAQWAIATLADDKVEEIVDNSEDGEHEVIVTINGVFVDFEKMVQSIENQFDSAVHKEANKIFPDGVRLRLDIIQNMLYDIEQDLDCLHVVIKDT